MDPSFDIPATVVSRRVGDEVMILDLESGTYFGLDPVGARVWELMREGRTLAGICEALMGEYAVGREVLERDVRRLAAGLEAEKLVEARA